MNIIISESQLKFIVENTNKSSFSEDMKSLYDFTKDILEKSKQKFGIDLTLLMTWGTAVGGLVMPLDNYIRTKQLDITEDQMTLILIGCISTLFIDNKRAFQKVYKLCKKDGIENILTSIILEGKKLRDSFIGFLLSLNMSVRNVTSLVRYSFLIPIITDIQNFADSSEDSSIVAMRIAERIIAAGVITISVESLTRLIEKILKKLS